MTIEKQIKITKKDGSSHIVPASQRSIYDAFNTKNTKLKKLNEVVTIEDYEAPPVNAAKVITATQTDSVAGSQATGDGKRLAVDVIALIDTATTPEEVETIVAGDTRVSILKAAEEKVAALSA